ncbi:hypothetical protein VST7929_01847 [Vibrio stylophorae]|uniref:SAM-dependent methyltransferase n=1 Tax=Vibrio stylophorae TaxID=659351 RepID=A0ABM8ZUI1_9VIBR|nr:class I SAM-dependent methyltransferase [Vibrio stylophorae]CAH0533965.1 hypothetical protein VST7929_01847 [Vibrio stylophorae]
MVDFSPRFERAGDARTEAQKLAFAPFAFQTALALRELGILKALDDAGDTGLTATALATVTGVSEYGVKVLLDMGLSVGIVFWQESRYILSKMGYFVEHDEMTRVNMDFTNDVCYKPLAHLLEAIKTGTPAGLKELGDWTTVYEGLSQLPEQAKQSWFAFDHYYSDHAFPALLARVFAQKPKHIVDIGGNTGKWALQCCRHDSDVAMTLVDLPQQLAVAEQNAKAAGFIERMHFHPANMLADEVQLPSEVDVWWMSQFLDCFSPMEVVRILRQVHAQMADDAKVYILELFWDSQRYEAASYSLNATSLYFTCVANGNSRFYRSDDFLELVKEAGFVVVQRDEVGVGHTLLELRKA